MEQSFIAFLEDSIKKNWDLDALTDYKGATTANWRLWFIPISTMPLLMGWIMTR